MSEGRECLLYQIRVPQKSVLLLFEIAQEGWRHKGGRVCQCRAWKAEKDVAVATEKEAAVLHSAKDGVEDGYLKPKSLVQTVGEVLQCLWQKGHTPKSQCFSHGEICVIIHCSRVFCLLALRTLQPYDIS